MMPIDEDVLARALQALPVGSHVSIARIEQRARTLRRRRRAAGLAGAAVLAAAVAAVVLTGAGNRLDLGPANAPTPCPTNDVPEIQWIPDRPPPEQVPDAMRLLWSESAAPAPATVVAEDLGPVYEEHRAYLDACGGPSSVQLIDVADGVVTRFLWFGSGALWQDRSSQDSDRTLEVGSTEVEIFEPYGDADLPPDLPIWPGYVTASWTRDGQDWLLYGGPVTDAELTELVRLAERFPDPGEPLEIDEWSVLADAEFVFHSRGAGDGSRLSYEVEGENLMLRVFDRPSAALPSVFAGDRVVDVAGRLAILHAEAGVSPILYWQPADGVYATFQGTTGAEELLEIAQTIAPVPADDERLAHAWFTRMSTDQ